MVAGELDDPLRPQPGRVDHARPVRVLADQFPGHLEGGPARRDARAAFGQQGVQPVAFRVGLPGQRAQVDRQGLRAAHQRGEPGRAERGIRVAVRRGLLHVRHQARVRGQRRLKHRLVEPRAASGRPRFRGAAVVGPPSSPAASPLTAPSSACATGELTWSSEATAASMARGQPARCSARAASRSAAGA